MSDSNSVFGYCTWCGAPVTAKSLENQYPPWRVVDDEVLCPYYRKRRLLFCEKPCLENAVQFVLSRSRQT